LWSARLRKPASTSTTPTVSTAFVSDYFEDETGKEITRDELGQILTGDPTVRFVPGGAKQHDIDLMFAEPKPDPLAEVYLSAEEVRLLGYFVRDLKARLFQEKTEQLADDLWQLAGCPNGGSALYLAQAREQLMKAVS
jgi:hypothetical protein